MKPVLPTTLLKVAPHLLIQNAFGADISERLLAFALAQEAAFTQTTVGRTKTFNPDIRKSRAIPDLGPLKDTLEANFRARIPQATAALGLTPFTLSHLSLQLAAHGDGDFYRRHIDTFAGSARTATDRVLTGVYYFHTVPKAFSGGDLRLFSIQPVEAGGTYIDIVPPNDSLLLFPSWVPHEVRQVSCPGGGFAQSRFAINCWYHRAAA